MLQIMVTGFEVQSCDSCNVNKPLVMKGYNFKNTPYYV